MRIAMWSVAAALFLVILRCEAGPELLPLSQSEPLPATVTLGSQFHPANCGRIAGRVTWDGPQPFAPHFVYGVPNPDGSFKIQSIPNPNRPTIDEKTAAVAGAVVFLRGVNPAHSRPWPHQPVRIEMKNHGIVVVQGDAASRAGFVRRGDAVVLESKEPAYHLLRARGAAFFGLTFPEPEQPLTRTFDKSGRVELSSGAGYYWASADLFVVDHPYYTQTDGDGRFAFDQVPAGAVEVVAWLPGWETVKQERDPETGLIFRQTYGPPHERMKSVSVAPRAVAEAQFAFSR